MSVSPASFVFLAFGGVGTPELIFVFIVVLLLFGPKRLPEVAKTIGKVMNDMRRASRDFQDQIMKIEEELPREEVSSVLKELTRPVELVTASYTEALAEPTSTEIGEPVSGEVEKEPELPLEYQEPPDYIVPEEDRPPDAVGAPPPPPAVEQEEPKQDGPAG